MKKIISLVLSLCILSVAFSQTTTPVKKDWSKVNLSNQAADHFMVQFSSDHWANMPDSISSHQSGFSRGMNIYLMINKPFKSDPRWSLAFGIGVGSSSIFFRDVDIHLEATGTNSLPFTNDSTSDHFRKYKLETSFLEIPIELRYTLNPEKQSKSWKFALGIKPGTMLDAHTKGKDELDGNGNSLNTSVQKVSSTSFFNTSRISATARVGYGNLSIFTSYQLTSMFKDGGADIKTYQVGLCISGL
jgi:outer membrane protein with beta-barrel domain